MKRIAVIIPARDEEKQIVAALGSAGCGVPEPGAGAGDETPRVAADAASAPQIVCVVVDGGSRDDTVARARAAGATVLEAEPGRAAQMNAGAAAVDADVLVFLHADTRLPVDWLPAIAARLAAAPGEAAWGRFDVRLDPSSPVLGVVAAAMNLRSRLTGIATGDQAIFLTRAAWNQVGGFPAIPLMEDVEISRRLKRAVGPPLCLRTTVRTSSRRWRSHGVLRTIARMWLYRALYFCGVPAAVLHRRYYGRAVDSATRPPGHLG